MNGAERAAGAQRYSRRAALRVTVAAALAARGVSAAPATHALPDDALDLLARSIRDDAIDARVEAVLGPGFDWALRLSTLLAPTPYAEGEYRWTVAVPTAAPVERGDVLEAVFTARADGTPDAVALTRFVFERVDAPNTKSASEPLVLDTDWQECRVRFRATERYEAGAARAVFYLGYEPQAFLIGNFSLINYGPGASLPPPTYAGRAPDASWRADAAARIEQHRMGTLRVTVQDRGGNRVAGAGVHVAMRRHAFAFGSAVTASRLLSPDESGARYRETVARLYNTAVFENDLKWREWEAGAPVIPALGMLRDFGLAVRGHTLVWPRWEHLPDDVAALRRDLPALRARVDAHIADEVGAFAGQLTEWDVVNEPYANHDLLDALGPAEMARWFQLARRADPAARLFLNDADFFEARGLFRRKQEYYARLIPALLDAGAPLGGVGMQSHFDALLPPIPRVLGILDRFAAYGLPIAITELDVDTTDERAQADFLGDFMMAAFSHPAVTGIVMWGFWEGQHWRPDAALYRRDWRVKPSGETWEELVTRRWWTDTRVRTGPDGDATVRGFLGEYTVSADAGGASATMTATLPPGGASITVTI